jgi:carbon storage regulator
MFIIARRRGQRIAIGDDIEVTVTEISRNTVKLGILAPQTCPIIRSELKDSVVQANREALRTHLSTARGKVESADIPEAAMETKLAGANNFLQPHVKTLTDPNVNRSTSDNEAAES